MKEPILSSVDCRIIARELETNKADEPSPTKVRVLDELIDKVNCQFYESSRPPSILDMVGEKVRVRRDAQSAQEYTCIYQSGDRLWLIDLTNSNNRIQTFLHSLKLKAWVCHANEGPHTITHVQSAMKLVPVYHAKLYELAAALTTPQKLVLISRLEDTPYTLHCWYQRSTATKPMHSVNHVDDPPVPGGAYGGHEIMWVTLNSLSKRGLLELNYLTGRHGGLTGLGEDCARYLTYRGLSKEATKYRCA